MTELSMDDRDRGIPGATMTDDEQLPAERPYRFVGGPWAGRVDHLPRAFTEPHHCRPHGENGSTWAPADSWPGEPRYAPDGYESDTDTVVMVWRTARLHEIERAREERAEWYADKYYDFDDPDDLT